MTETTREVNRGGGGRPRNKAKTANDKKSKPTGETRRYTGGIRTGENGRRTAEASLQLDCRIVMPGLEPSPPTAVHGSHVGALTQAADGRAHLCASSDRHRLDQPQTHEMRSIDEGERVAGSLLPVVGWCVGVCEKAEHRAAITSLHDHHHPTVANTFGYARSSHSSIFAHLCCLCSSKGVRPSRNRLVASTARPDANACALDSVLATENARVPGVLADLHLLYHLPQRRAIPHTIFAGDARFLGALQSDREKTEGNQNKF